MSTIDDAASDAARDAARDDAAARQRTPGQLTGSAIVVALVSAISGMLYGYDTGIISGALLQITKDFQIEENWKQFIAASILLGAVIGALTCSFLSERIGRKTTLLMLAVIFAVGALGCAVAPDPLLLSVGRLVLRIRRRRRHADGADVRRRAGTPKYRGRLVLCFQIAIGVGIVIATIVGASESVPWRWSIGAACVPALLMLGLLLRLPESPRWLVKHDDRDRAREVLARVRPENYDTDGELEEMAALAREEETANTRGWSGLRKAWVRPALILGCGIAIFTQLSGIEMIIYYSPTILTDNGFDESVALQVSVALGVTYLVAQLVGLSIIDKVGRRRLTLIMIPGAAVSLFVLGALFVTGNSGRDSVPFIITCLVLFMLFNAGGLQLMGWLTGSETYPLAVRPAGTAAQSAALWGTNLLITLTLLTLISGIGVGPSMWLYGLFNVAAWLFVYFRMPT